LTGNEIIVVEGRADVVNLLKNNVKNVVAMNGTKLPEGIRELSREKEVTLFVDGDRGGKLIIQNVLDNADVKYIAIGDGGNEMGMGKVIEKIRHSDKIMNGDKIGAVTMSDYLIASSVSNWGGYALSAACAVIKKHMSTDSEIVKEEDQWVQKLMPSEDEEIQLLKRCVQAGCRDGVSGKMEMTVDGMSLETSLTCLGIIRKLAEE
jgi:hypothetical protein